jgi:hypothetical protein
LRLEGLIEVPKGQLDEEKIGANKLVGTVVKDGEA